MALQPGMDFQELHPHAFDSDDIFLEGNVACGGTLPRQTASSHTVGRSAHTSCKVTTAPSSPLNQRPLKRQRQESPQSGDMDIAPPDSRDAMPPPSKPILRMRSMRRIIPKIRKKFSHTRSTSPMDDVRHGASNTHMNQHGNWQTDTNQQPPIRDQYQEGLPYISGASPVEQHCGRGQPDPQLLSSTSIRDTGSESTFQAQSPVNHGGRMNGHHPVQVPTEPFYIRLMDGLSQGRDMELELKDPRLDNARNHHEDQGAMRNQMTESDWQPRKVHKKKSRRNPGQMFFHHSPYRSASTDPSRAGLTQASSSVEHQQAPKFPVTPSPRRHEQSHYQAESVVSPYFTDSHRRAPPQSRTGLAEPQASSNLSGAFQYHRPKLTRAPKSWHNPPSLNGLSFFDSPVNSRNEFILEPFRRGTEELHHETQPIPNRNLNSRGFIIRPHATRSPFAGHGTYRSSHHQSKNNRVVPPSAQSAVSSPSFRTACSRPLQDSSARLSVASGLSPIRTSTQWEPLQRAGVRSSRQTFDMAAENTYSRSSRNLMSNYARRNIRR